MRASPTSSPLSQDRLVVPLGFSLSSVLCYSVLVISKVRAARDAASVATAQANRLSVSYGLGVAIGTALTIQVSSD